MKNLLLKFKYYLGLRSLRCTRLVIKRLIARLGVMRAKTIKAYLLWAKPENGEEKIIIAWSYKKLKLDQYANTYYKKYHIESKNYTPSGLKACMRTLREIN